MRKETKTNYYKNGKKAHETPYINNRIHGLQIGWWPNGDKWYETPYKNNLEHGTIIDFNY